MANSPRCDCRLRKGFSPADIALLDAAICHGRAARPTGKRSRARRRRVRSGFSGFVLQRGRQPLPECRKLGRVRSRLR